MNPKRPAAGLLAGAVLLLCCPAVWAQQVKVLSKHSVAFRAEPPTFKLDQLVPLDRGKLLYIGRGIRGEQETAHLLRLRDRKVLRLKIPVARYLQRTRGEKDPWERFRVGRLLRYDTASKTAGLELTERGQGAARTHHWLVWDLEQDKITKKIPVGRSDEQRWTTFRVVGSGADASATFYLRVTRTRSGASARGAPRYSGPSKVTLLAIEGGAAREVAEFEIPGRVHSRTYFDPGHARVLVAQYAERAHGTLPRGAVVDVGTGKVKLVTLPFCTYGAAFDRTGKTLLAYSGQTGELWAIDLVTGKPRRKVNLGQRGHALGFVLPGKLLLLRNKGLQFVSARGLRKTRFVASKQLYGGISHVEGSLVLAGRVALRNRSRELYLLSVTP